MQMNFTAMALLLQDEATIAQHPAGEQPVQRHARPDRGAAPPDERELIQRIRSAQDEVLTTVADIANLIRDGKIDEAMALQLTRGYPLYQQIEGLVGQIVTAEEAGMASLRASVAAAIDGAVLMTARFAGVSIALALVLGFVISWSFILPVREAHGVPQPGGEGRLRRDDRGPESRRVRRSGGPHERDEPRARDGSTTSSARPASSSSAQRRAGAGEPGQVRLPGQHEPRAAHAAQRGPGLHRDDPRRASTARCRPGSGSRSPTSGPAARNSSA